MLETVLVDPRYRLVRAGSADEALLPLVSEEFTLIILDIHMPDMNGFELADLIKKRKKTAEVPIIFLTAYFSDDRHVLEGYSTGRRRLLAQADQSYRSPVEGGGLCRTLQPRRECELSAKNLFSEVAERRRVQEELLLLNRELEQRVEERTRELLEATRPSARAKAPAAGERGVGYGPLGVEPAIESCQLVARMLCDPRHGKGRV